MGAEEDWILFLEKNPQFYELTKGDFFIQFLEEISKGAKSFDNLKLIFPNVEEKDLQTVMETFLKLKVVSKIMLGPKVFFGITAAGKRLLSAYKKAKRFFST
jgi:hypothetical protein